MDCDSEEKSRSALATALCATTARFVSRSCAVRPRSSHTRLLVIQPCHQQIVSLTEQHGRVPTQRRRRRSSQSHGPAQSREPLMKGRAGNSGVAASRD